MKDIKNILQLSTAFLQKQEVKRPRFLAESLLAHFLGLKRVELYMYFDRPILEEELHPFRLALKRIIKKEPLDYVLGSVEFYHAILKVTKDVLIPRPETELLLDMAVCRLTGKEKKVLDLCCGSGCLAIGLKKACPQLEVVGVDLSLEALELARYNASHNEVEITFLQGDLLAPVLEQKFDLVLCNPPYIGEAEFALLDPSVKDYEPKLALVSGPTGYEFYVRLHAELPKVLASHAQVFFEIGSTQKNEVMKIFSTDLWEDLKVEQDLAGHDRFFSLKRKDFSSIIS